MLKIWLVNFSSLGLSVCTALCASGPTGGHRAGPDLGGARPGRGFALALSPGNLKTCKQKGQCWDFKPLWGEGDHQEDKGNSTPGQEARARKPSGTL